MQLDIAASFGEFEPLVVLVNRDRKPLLRFVLPNHIFIEKALDLLRFGQICLDGRRRRLLVVIDDLVADINAFVADIDAGAGD